MWLCVPALRFTVRGITKEGIPGGMGQGRVHEARGVQPAQAAVQSNVPGPAPIQSMHGSAQWLVGEWWVSEWVSEWVVGEWWVG